MKTKYLISFKWALLLFLSTFLVRSVAGLLLALVVNIFLVYEYSYRAAREAINKKVGTSKNLGTEVGIIVSTMVILPSILFSLFFNTLDFSSLIFIVLGLLGGKRADQGKSPITL